MSRKNIFSFAIAFILLVVVIILDRRSFMEMSEYTGKVENARQLITSLEELSSRFKSAQVYSASYAKKASAEFYDLYRREAEKLGEQLDHISRLKLNSPEQKKKIDSLTEMMRTQIPFIIDRNIVELIQQGEGWRLEELLAIHQLINIIIDEENHALQVDKQELQRTSDYSTMLSTSFFILAISLILATFFYNLFLSRKRKWLEGFLESVLNTTENGVVSYKAIRQHGEIVDFKITYANAAVKKLLKLDPADLIGKQLKELPIHDGRTELMEKYITVVKTAELMQYETLEEVDGVKKWFYVLLGKMEDGLTATFHDITALKNYQEELHSNIQTLAGTNKELEQYAYVASHDLQEPLRKIMVYANMLINHTDTRLDDKATNYLSKITSAAERMSILITDILNFSGLKKEPVMVPTDLNEVVNNVIEDQELRISQLDAVIDKDPLPIVDAIPLQMNQLFYNLLSNSLKFAREGVLPKIAIRSGQLSSDELAKHDELEKDRSYYRIDFIDNGIGFKPDYGDQIFGMFKRLNDRQKFPGSGIGLAICRKVVANHKGLIMAQGSEGGGATFTVILPAKATK